MTFPNATFHDIEQRTPEWRELRNGVLTASDFGVWLAERPKVRLTIADIRKLLASEHIAAPKDAKHADLVDLLPNPEPYLSLTVATADARAKMITKKLAEIAGCEGPEDVDVDPDGPPPRNRSLWAVWNGLRLEPDARERFSDMTRQEVTECGFALHKSGRFGCSPDGIITPRKGLEIKCPLPETHIGYLFDGGLPDTYKAQVHGSMAVTGADEWEFFSYCPGLPPHRVTVERDHFTEDMLAGLMEFSDELDAKHECIAQLWDAAYPHKEVAASVLLHHER
jgi:hypothetical protein